MNYKGLFKQVITLWEKSSVDGYGKPSFSSPDTFYGRWQDEKIIQKTVDGVKEIVYNSIIYTDTVLEEGDFVYLGTSVVSNPLTVAGAREVKNVSMNTDLGGRYPLYVAYLKER